MKSTQAQSEITQATASEYDPFLRGPYPVGVRTFQARDAARNRLFPCELWHPAAEQHAGQDLAPETQDVFTVPQSGKQRRQMAVREAQVRPGAYPLILFSHPSGAHRRAATFLCTHLASHGYVVAALDHSEVSAPELGRKEGETEQEKLARRDAVIASRVPDARFLLDFVLETTGQQGIELDSSRIGIAGHSFGAWTALAINDVDQRMRAVVALSPGGASNPRPGILPVKLAFNWGRDIPTLYLAAENDVALPLPGMYEIFERTPAAKQMVILRRADHMHFMDNVEEIHERMRTMPVPPELAWIQKEMLPISELCSGEQAQLFVRGLTLAHMDAVLRGHGEAQRFRAGDIENELSRRGVQAIVHKNALAAN